MKARVPGHVNPGMHEVLQRGVPNAETFPANQKLGLCCARDLAHFNRRSTITEDQFSRDGDPFRGACYCGRNIDPGQPVMLPIGILPW